MKEFRAKEHIWLRGETDVCVAPYLVPILVLLFIHGKSLRIDVLKHVVTEYPTS